MTWTSKWKIAMDNDTDLFLHDILSRWQLCRFCTHLYNLVGDLRCAAFPIGIPREITSGELIHNKPLPDQENDLFFHACSGNG